MAAITSAVLASGTAGYQIYKGEQDRKKAQEALNNYKRQDLVNPYKDVQISTVGSDLMREEAGRNSSGLVDASRGSIDSVMGNVPKIVAYNNTQNRNAQEYLDDQVGKREYAIAGDQSGIRGIQENRDNMDLSGIGTRLNVGRQDMWNGMRGLVGAGMYGANNINFGNSTPNVNNVNQITPIGASSYATPTSPLPSLYNNNYGF